MLYSDSPYQGYDNFQSGLRQAYAGLYHESATIPLLKNFGLSHENAHLAHEAFGTFSTTYGVMKLGILSANMNAVSRLPSITSTAKEAEMLQFTDTAGKHMYEAERRIPMHLLDEIIQSPIAVIRDPQGASNALMYYSQMWRNGKLYNCEVLYEKATNTISHFRYGRDPMGPLKQIPKPPK